MYTQFKILSENPIYVSNVAEKIVKDNKACEVNNKIPIVRSAFLGATLIWSLLVFVGFVWFGIAIF